LKDRILLKWYNSKAALRIWIVLIPVFLVVFFIGLQGILGSVFPPLDFLGFISAKKLSAFVRELVLYTSKRVTVDLLLIALGIWGIYVAVKRALYSVLTVLKPSNKEDFVGTVYERLKLTRGPVVTVLGGAAGLMPVLHGLKKYTNNINAVILPSEKNIRSAMLALSDAESLNKLFGYNFAGTKLSEFNLGDLYIKAMTEVAGDTERALSESANVFSLAGRIYPLVKDRAALEYTTDGGRKITEESSLLCGNLTVKAVGLQAASGRANEKVLELIKTSDAVVLGPGSLYADILPFFLVKGVSEALFASRGIKIFVPALMALKYEPGKPVVSRQVKTILAYAKKPVIDAVVVNEKELPEEALVIYRRYRSVGYIVDDTALKELGIRVVKRGMSRLTEDGFIRHDPQALGRALIKLISI
jgi:uncharacterized cofD-like protein